MSNPTDTETSATEASTGSRRSRRKLLLGALALAVLGVASTSFAYYELYGRHFEDTEDAYVDGNQVQIAAGIAGTVTRINVDDGDYVEQGQTLVQLDPSDTEVALEEAQADLAATVRRVRGLYADVSHYRAQVSTRELDVKQARDDYQRRVELGRSGAVAREEVTHARDTLESAENALTSAKQQLNSTLALVEGTTLDSHPEVKAAAATLRKAYINHARATIQSPVSGYVAKRSVHPGAHIASGEPLMAVIPLDQVWIDANFKETQLGQMRIGQPVEVHADLYGDDVTYHGQIESLGMGTGSAFSLLPAQNASGNWIKIVQRVPVRIQLDPQELQSHPLRIGLSTQVSVDLHQQQGDTLPQQPHKEARYSTDIYDSLLADADALVHQVIAANAAGDIHASIAKVEP
ncbi:HlyD family secretion protein [Marinobacterium lutimaris]|uniref:Membrane fusion protein, multidrug efflux system n=1 Tax=Marinobacterium lutimaris TaxID=568106 RepID=A0A1H6DHZ5_9GAMM|nr:efflux RND transporter periplasmic adaptor subunit [Marinobacterium lutimaris]SEG84928.1 membrane fusion protein, multidrug efflux system [Marinobacterium lutimaris]